MKVNIITQFKNKNKMNLSMEAIAVQKNAAELIEEILFALSDVPGGHMDGDHLSMAYHNEELWKPEKWGGEQNMQYHKDMVFIARKLFDMSENIEVTKYRITETDLLMRKVLAKEYDELRTERLKNS